MHEITLTLSGPPGCGKTFLRRKIEYILEKEGDDFCILYGNQKVNKKYFKQYSVIIVEKTK